MRHCLNCYSTTGTACQVMGGFLIGFNATLTHCGECTACCRTFSIPELDKKAGVWCQHCAVGKGCKIYPTRPKVCANFGCLWLLSQFWENGDGRLAPELRPDRSKVVITTEKDHRLVSFITMPGSPDAWRKPLVREIVNRAVRGGLIAVISQPGSTRKIEIDKFGEREIEMTLPDEDGMQWNVNVKKGLT